MTSWESLANEMLHTIKSNKELWIKEADGANTEPLINYEQHLEGWIDCWERQAICVQYDRRWQDITHTMILYLKTNKDFWIMNPNDKQHLEQQIINWEQQVQNLSVPKET